MTETTETKKLTRADACVAIAQTIWPQAEVAIGSALSDVAVKVDGKWTYFNPFRGRDAAVELVRWIYQQPFTVRVRFGHALDGLLWGSKEHQAWNERFEYLLAEPEQISTAACAALGIEVE